MNRIARFVVTTATAAAALIAGPARAHDRDCDHPTAPEAAYPAAPRAVYPAPQAANYPAYPVAPAPVYAPAPAPGPRVVVRPAYWENGRRFHELRDEYRRLDESRDQFYASWHGNPWRRNRFEAWYASRRADLDRRWAELEQRPHTW